MISGEHDLTPAVWVAPTFIDSSNRGVSAIARSLPFFRSWLLSPCSESVKTVDAF